MFRAVQAQAGRAPVHRGQCYAAKRVGIFQRIAGKSLAGNN
jgi:hypothetical protein